MNFKDTKCDLCGELFDRAKGESEKLLEIRHGEYIYEIEVCGECYKEVSRFIKDKFRK
jgi:hypothetical protein